MKINHDIGVILEWYYLKQEYQSDNANKIIVSQDFGGNKYGKINK